MDIASLSDALHFDAAAGIWRAGRTSSISYPADDNAACFRVEDGSFWFAHRNRCIIAAVRRFEPAGFVLDIGGGNGYVARGLMDAGYDAVVLEPGAAGARNAREGCHLPAVINATLEDAMIRDASVPSAGLFDVLEHIEDDRGFIARLHAITRPAACLYLTVPAFTWLWSASDVDAMHHRRYTHASLAKALDGRFEILYATYLFGLLVPAVVVRRTLPYALGLERRRSVEAYESDHEGGGGGMSRVFERLLAGEVRAIERGQSRPIGSTLLAVARRIA